MSSSRTVDQGGTKQDLNRPTHQARRFRPRAKEVKVRLSLEKAQGDQLRQTCNLDPILSPPRA